MTLPYDSPHYDDAEEARTETARTNAPRRRSLQEAVEFGDYNPRDEFEDQP